MKRRIWGRTIIAFILVAMMGTTPVCEVQAARKVIQSVKFMKPTKKTLVLKKGKTYTLKTKVKGTGIIDKRVRYTTSNKKIVKVSKKGVLTAVKNGTATIKAISVANKKKYAKLKVIVGKKSVEKVNPQPSASAKPVTPVVSSTPTSSAAPVVSATPVVSPSPTVSDTPVSPQPTDDTHYVATEMMESVTVTDSKLCEVTMKEADEYVSFMAYLVEANGYRFPLKIEYKDSWDDIHYQLRLQDEIVHGDLIEIVAIKGERRDSKMSQYIIPDFTNTTYVRRTLNISNTTYIDVIAGNCEALSEDFVPGITSTFRPNSNELIISGQPTELCDGKELRYQFTDAYGRKGVYRIIQLVGSETELVAYTEECDVIPGYSTTSIKAYGGSGGYRFEAVDDLTEIHAKLNASTGSLSFTQGAEPGTYNVKIKVIDKNDDQLSKVVTQTVHLVEPAIWTGYTYRYDRESKTQTREDNIQIALYSSENGKSYYFTSGLTGSEVGTIRCVVLPSIYKVILTYQGIEQQIGMVDLRQSITKDISFSSGYRVYLDWHVPDLPDISQEHSSIGLSGDTVFYDEEKQMKYVIFPNGLLNENNECFYLIARDEDDNFISDDLGVWYARYNVTVDGTDTIIHIGPDDWYQELSD